VGGCVRDFLLGKTPNDFDITTDALPEQMRQIFSDVRTVDTGIKHGTLTVIVDSVPYEVTTYRIDGEYTDNRHPDKVSFTGKLSDDLSRRDFTVNAMCYNENDGLTDIFGGKEDLKAGIIRAVGDPVLRFSEDSLRILRALRFASTLDFEIEPETSKAIFKTSALLSNVSRERIYAEWKKLISGTSASRILRKYGSVICEVIPELSDVCNYSLPLGFDKADPEIRELSLFCLGLCEDASLKFSSAMKSLRSDNKHIK
jgi:tRNA nucleotidyltransferase (CCA-adding enzyme)